MQIKPFNRKPAFSGRQPGKNEMSTNIRKMLVTKDSACIGYHIIHAHTL